MKPTKLTPRFERALAMAHRLHQRQTRKSTGIPYISHLLAVCSLVLEDGGNENEAIAALLHDAAEDQGGISTLKRIKKAFGPTVADLVAGCSDTFQTPKPPWKARKVAYLNHLAKASPSIQCIVAADKLHNIRCTLHNLLREGGKVWDRFSAGRGDQLWYYKSVHRILARAGRSGHVRELGETIDRLSKVRA